jgi:hypothetical protein
MMQSARHRGGYYSPANRAYAPLNRSLAPLAGRTQAGTHHHNGQPPRFYVDEDGRGHLEPGDRVVFEVGSDGNVSVAVENGDKENGGNGNGVEVSRRSFGWFGRRHTPLGTRQGVPRQVDKLTVSQNSDGTLTIHPTTEDGVLQVTGDPAMGQVVVTEIEPVDNVPAAA